MIASIRRRYHEVAGDDAQAGQWTRSAFLGMLAAGVVAAGAMLPAGPAESAGRRRITPVTDLDRFYDAWQERFNAADLEAMLDLYVPDAVYVNPEGKQLIGHAGLRADFESMFAAKPVIDLHDRHHIAYRDTAITTNRWTMTIPKPDGSKETLTGGGIEVVRRQADGGWRFIIDDASRAAG